ncbi:hypothetical protein [Thermoflexus sp.]|uniref:hypothetical protein n=1 Tax=Thermoflexus sp. TaxID=1969742 RepID=UPI0025F02B4B|nr:hypothetical protein [Thermoflexus sp.]MDW8181696.1 hypothetical protein [Anaerolineae bacterium]MCS6965112.1 hypothetical protein [Thermoflexus sp.]MCS7352234.1 hypothetical protein [Thermoflexus sp.]MCX7689567.1 hypothetical protein [Thermoflexus sp.]MDW8184589.1 hypothetical protein [Anaerolineae bacterium]
MKDLTLLVMVGPIGNHLLEQQMGRILRVAAQETIHRIMDTGRAARVILAAPDQAGLESLEKAPFPLEWDLDRGDRSFEFGARLAGLIQRHQISRLLYVGAGAAPLMSTAGWEAVLTAFAEMEEGLLTNNLHSSDWIAVAPAEAILAYAHRLPTDNAMAWVLHREAGLPARVWPRSTASLLDLDTPVDAMIVAQHPQAPLALREAVARTGWDPSRVRQILTLLRTPGSRLVLAGRVPSWAWAALERHAQIWTRVFSEERGMQASARMHRGEVRSLVYTYLQAVGPRRFFETLGELADGALLDIRVWMAAAGRWPAPVDRYAADLFAVLEIQDPVIREWIEAAVQAPLTVLVGGHTLVAAGLVALLEAALGVPCISL